MKVITIVLDPSYFTTAKPLALPLRTLLVNKLIYHSSVTDSQM